MSPSHATNKIPRNQWYAAFAASSVMLASGIDIIWLNNIERHQPGVKLFGETCAVIIGAIFGAVIADIFGRKKTLLVSSAISLIVRIVYCQNEWILMNTLFIHFGSAVTCIVVPLYISEISNSNNCGNLMALQLLVSYLGSYFTGAVTIILFFAGINYRIVTPYTDFGLLVISVIFHVIYLALHPDTPQFLFRKQRYEDLSKSLDFFKGIRNARVEQVPQNPSTNSDVTEKIQEWGESIREIFEFENRRNMAIIFILILIRRASGQEWNSLSLYNITWFKFSPINNVSHGFMFIIPAVILVCCVFITLAMGLLERKSSVLVIIAASFLPAVIGITNYAKYFSVLCGIILTQCVCQLALLGITLAYVGKFFPINVRAIASAAIIIWEVLVRNIIFLINYQLSGPFVHKGTYLTTLQSYSNFGVLLAGFFVVLIFFPKTNTVPCSEIPIKYLVDRECVPMEELNHP